MDTATTHPAESAVYCAYRVVGERLEVHADSTAFVASTRKWLATIVDKTSQNAANRAGATGTVEWAVAAHNDAHGPIGYGAALGLIDLTNAALQRKSGVLVAPDVTLSPWEVKSKLKKANIGVASWWDAAERSHRLGVVLRSEIYRCVNTGHPRNPKNDRFVEVGVTGEGVVLVRDWFGLTRFRPDWRRATDADIPYLDAIALDAFASGASGWEVYA